MSTEPGREPTAGRPSILDVAALAGVSPATVSRSLRGQSKVAPQTRRRVLDAARELSYVASPQASGLASGRTRAVAVVVPFITRWFFSTVVAGVTDVLRESGYDVILYHLGSANDRDRFFERMPLARRVDGILSLSMPLTDEHTLALRALDIPLVSVGSHVPGSPSVRIDEVAAAQTAVNHLLHQGHEQIGFIAGVPDDPGFGFVSSEHRRQGYEPGPEAAGLTVDPDLTVTGRYGDRRRRGRDGATPVRTGTPDRGVRRVRRTGHGRTVGATPGRPPGAPPNVGRGHRRPRDGSGP